MVPGPRLFEVRFGSVPGAGRGPCSIPHARGRCRPAVPSPEKPGRTIGSRLGGGALVGGSGAPRHAEASDDCNEAPPAGPARLARAVPAAIVRPGARVARLSSKARGGRLPGAPDRPFGGLDARVASPAAVHRQHRAAPLVNLRSLLIPLMVGNGMPGGGCMRNRWGVRRFQGVRPGPGPRTAPRFPPTRSARPGPAAPDPPATKQSLESPLLTLDA